MTAALGAGVEERLTIVTVVKNGLPGLKLTHSSLEAQSSRKFRWLVMDGLSGDGTAEWIASLNCPWLEWRSGKDKSIYDAMNKAVEWVKTTHFLYLNAGDTFRDPAVAARIIEGIENGDPDVAYGQCVIMAGGGFPERLRGRRVRGRLGIFYGHVPCHQATLIAKRAFAAVGPYDTGMRVYADREWLMRLLAQGNGFRITYWPFPIVNYEPSGFSYQKFFTFAGEYFGMLRKHGNVFEIAWGTLGWLKAAVHNALSKLSTRISGGSPARKVPT